MAVDNTSMDEILQSSTEPKSFSFLSVNDLLMAAPKLEVQLALAGLHTIMWYIMINFIWLPIGIWLISTLTCKKQFLRFNRHTFKKLLMYDMGDDESFQIEFTARFEGIILQHGVGGLLCLLSVLGFARLLPDNVALAMARHGVLCEVGWEISDNLQPIFDILFGGEMGRKKNPV